MTEQAGAPVATANHGPAREAAHLFAAGRVREATVACIRILAGDPGNALALHILGIAAGQRQDHGTAARLLLRAYRSNPAVGPHNLVTAFNNLGLALCDGRRPQEAIAQYEQALEILPDDPTANLGRATAFLLLGDFERGWDGYRWRWSLPRQAGTMPNWPRPLWNGDDVPGKSVLVWCEQGFGDAIQFIRYATLVQNRGARVSCLCRPELARLFASVAGLDVIANGTPLPPFDVHAPLLELPRLFGTSLTTIPSRVPYLSADPGQVRAWAAKLRPHTGLRVGLVWAGSPRTHDPSANAVDRRRSMTLEHLAPLGRIPGVTLFSLQKGDASRQAAAPPAGMTLVDWTDELRDFADTAALIAGLDLVVSVDTSVAHLAGALGKPVWLLSRFDGCWRWLLDRSDSPWYPTMRIFRQPRPGDWDPAVRRIAGELEAAAALTP